jgi:hypothetical protein
MPGLPRGGLLLKKALGSFSSWTYDAFCLPLPIAWITRPCLTVPRENFDKNTLREERRSRHFVGCRVYITLPAEIKALQCVKVSIPADSSNKTTQVVNY